MFSSPSVTKGPLVIAVWECMCVLSLQSCPTHCSRESTARLLSGLKPVRFSRQEYWHGLPCPPSEALSDQGTEQSHVHYGQLGGSFLFYMEFLLVLLASVCCALHCRHQHYPCLSDGRGLKVSHGKMSRFFLVI